MSEIFEHEFLKLNICVNFLSYLLHRPRFLAFNWHILSRAFVGAAL